jgi:hypothetical protein
MTMQSFDMEDTLEDYKNIYRGTQGFRTSLEAIGPLTFMLEDCYNKYYVA